MQPDLFGNDEVRARVVRERKHAERMAAEQQRAMNRRIEQECAAKPTGESLAREGMARSASSAERAVPGWAADAYSKLVSYARAAKASFAIEEVKDWAYANGLQVPPNPGSWGSVTRRAVRDGVIEFDRFETSKNPTQHGKAVKLWHSL